MLTLRLVVQLLAVVLEVNNVLFALGNLNSSLHLRP